MKTTLNIKSSSKQPTQFQFTLSDDKLLLVRRKLFIFRETWNIVRDVKKSEKQTIFWDSYNVKVKFTDYHDEVIAKQLLESVYLNANRVRYLKMLEGILSEKHKHNSLNMKDLLLFGSETTYEEALQAYISNNEDIRSDEYVVRLLNDVRLCLFLIGREYEWKHDGKHVSAKMPGDVPIVIGDACNPISNSLKQNVRNYLKGLKRMGKITVVTKEIKDDECNNNSDNDSDAMVRTLCKNCLPASIAVCYHLIQEILLELLQSVRKQLVSSRITNLANVLLVTMCCLHEGCRPVEVILSQKHSNFYFWFNEVQYPILVLAFVKPETLCTLMESGVLLRYTVDFYKAKKLKKYRSRVKSWLPIQYNSLDLATIYVIVMRILAAYDLQSMCDKIINTSDQAKLTKRLKTIVNGMCIQKLSWYSIRTAAAEEDKEFNIPIKWSRYRMGHTKDSPMINRYANNLNQRVVVDEHVSLLGCDVSAEGATDDDIVPLFFKKEQGQVSLNQNDIPIDITSELNKVHNALRKLICDNNTLQPNSKLYIAKDKTALLADLRMIPFGSEFVFMDKLIPTSATYRNNVSETHKAVQTFFKPVVKDYNKIVLWSYPQVMYGEFNSKLNHDAKTNSNKAYQQQQDCITFYESLAVRLGVEPDKIVSRSKHGDTVDEINKRLAKRKTDSVIKIQPSKKVKRKQWFFADIEVNDVVALRCYDINPDYISIPGTSNGFRLMYVQTVNASSMSISGQYYRGSIYELVVKHDTVTRQAITDNDVMWIWSLDEGEDPNSFSLSDDDIVEFCSNYR